MTIITGTAMSKNTPVEVLQELECQERRAIEQGKTSYIDQPAKDREEQNARATQVYPHSVTPVRK